MLRSVVNYANNSTGEMSVVADDATPTVDPSTCNRDPFGRLVQLRAGHGRNGEREKESGAEGREKETTYEIVRRKRDVRRWRVG